MSYFPNYKDTHPSIRGRLYAASSSRPKFIPVPTQDNGVRRFAFLHGIFDGAKLQPRIHAAEITIIHRGRSHRFLFFFKNHRCLPENQTVRKMTSNVFWNGDIVIMRRSSRGPRIVNMRKNDEKLADFALKKGIRVIAQGHRVRIPKDIKFTK